MQDDGIQVHYDDGITLDCSPPDFDRIVAAVLASIPETADLIESHPDEPINYLHVNRVGNLPRPST